MRKWNDLYNLGNDYPQMGYIRRRPVPPPEKVEFIVDENSMLGLSTDIIKLITDDNDILMLNTSKYYIQNDNDIIDISL